MLGFSRVIPPYGLVAPFLRPDPFFEFVPFGEALNPGPFPTDSQQDRLVIGTANPTTLLGKEPDVCLWGRGIYGFSETAATAEAQSIITSRFRAEDFNVVWSPPVQPFPRSSAKMRGMAGGSAIVTTFPIRRALQPLPSDIANSHRYAEAFVALHQHHHIKIISIYGATLNRHSHFDGLAITNRLFDVAALRAINHNGPVAIIGDFNCDLHDIPTWNTLATLGWKDCAALSGQLHGHPLEPTCKDTTRYSYILANAALAPHLVECRTRPNFQFDAHPLLSAIFRVRNILSTVPVWTLPPSFGRYLIDQQLADKCADAKWSCFADQFENALACADIQKAAKIWTRVAEQTLSDSVVDAEGHRIFVKPHHLGRADKFPVKPKPPTTPLARLAGDGDFEPLLDQPDVESRRHTRQLRRLQSCVRQIEAWEKRPSESASHAIADLWAAITSATGFHKGFPFWVATHLGLPYPQLPPDSGAVKNICNGFYEAHTRAEKVKFIQRASTKRMEIAADVTKGAKGAFREVRDAPAAPLSEVHYTQTSNVKIVAWPKRGRCIIPLPAGHDFTQNLLVSFQGQDATVLQSHASYVVLDKRLRLRNRVRTITQHCVTIDTSAMHAKTRDAWAP